MLRIVEDIVSLICEVAPLVARVERRDAALAKQFRNALNSALLNTSEGSGQHGARRAYQYAIALGSADEAFVALRGANAWGYIAPLDPHMVDKFKKIICTLNKVARH